ncbi:hypothetical protein ACA910_020798 [Epithemia clementina (nom. ined.)]
MPAPPKIAGTIRSKNPLKGAVEILPERLYYAALKQPPPSHNILASTPKRDPNLPKEKRQIHFFNIDQELVYWNFFLDFGPLNLGQLTRFCHKLNDKMRKFPVVCFYSFVQPAKRANAQFLICAWQVLYLKRTPRQAYAGFLTAENNHEPPSAEHNNYHNNSNSMILDTEMANDGDGDNKNAVAPLSPTPYHTSNGDSKQQTLGMQQSLPPISSSQGAPTVAPLPPFHDASPVACTYELSVLDCLDGLLKAVQFGFWNIEDFDLEEYEHFEQVENGDLNWLVKGRILAFAGPSYQRHVSPEGYCTLAPADYIPYFKQQKVDLVVRLNKKNYHEKDFEDAGIRHVEHFFVDGSCPSMKVLNAVLTDFEAVPEDKAFAVHCKAGLGRTGTCIGAYLMKHFRFTAAEVIGWMRICRPGCVIGPQQQFLQTIQARMWQAGEATNIPRNRFFLKATALHQHQQQQQLLQQQQQQRQEQSKATPESPRQRLTKDAVEGRAGQGESLLAARAARQQHNNSNRTALPTPPITPESKEKRPAIVTPDSSSPPPSPPSPDSHGNNKNNSNNSSKKNKGNGGLGGSGCDDAAAAIANSAVCGAGGEGHGWLS